jgi:hypothetical protein
MLLASQLLLKGGDGVGSGLLDTWLNTKGGEFSDDVCKK